MARRSIIQHHKATEAAAEAALMRRADREQIEILQAEMRADELAAWQENYSRQKAAELAAWQEQQEKQSEAPAEGPGAVAE